MSRKVALSAIPTVSQLLKGGQIQSSVPNASLPKYAALSSRVALFQGDITTLQVDGIVNAANETLLGGGGVDGAIHRAAGPELKEECRSLKGCRTGDAKVTKGYALPAQHVIHTVGPVYAKGRAAESRDQLYSAYRRCLEEAAQLHMKSIAFPSISTGIYGYPMEDATNIAIEAVGTFLQGSEAESVDRVIFCVFSQKDYEVYSRLLGNHFTVE